MSVRRASDNHDDPTTMVVGNCGGRVALHEMSPNIIDAHWQECYAHCYHYTDVMVPHLMTGHEMRISCPGRVDPLAMYQDHLEIQMGDDDGTTIVIYDTPNIRIPTVSGIKSKNT